MKRILVFVLALTLLLSLPCLASAEEPGWIGAYADLLQQWQAKLAAEGGDLVGSYSNGYTLYDIDKDGTPELILKTGTCEADFHGFIYTFSESGGVVCVCDDFGLGHSSLYTYPGENGLILMYGHMGYAGAEHLILTPDGLQNAGTLYEDDLNVRLQNDPDADYIYPGDVVAGSVYLDLFCLDRRLPLERYEEIERMRDEGFPGAVACGDYPQGDPEFFTRVMMENREVVAVSADGYTRSPGRIGFQDLLKQGAAADWMYADLQILSTQLADLNGDGQPECIVDLNQGENSEPMRFFLSEQEGTVYAYLENYASKSLTVDLNGNLLCGSEYYSGLKRLLFDGEEALFLTLPLAYYAG